MLQCVESQPGLGHPIGGIDNLGQRTGIILDDRPIRTVGCINHDQNLDITVRRITFRQRGQRGTNIRLVETGDNDRQGKMRRRFRGNLKWVQLASFQVLIDNGPASLDRHSRIKNRHKDTPLTRKSIDLLLPTPSAWTETVLADFDTFLQDHANCERKASALAMSFVVKYPDRKYITESLIELAQEELTHFRDVYQLMLKRGILLAKDEPDHYVNQLLAAARHGADERFMDRMLISSVVECRGAERFGLLADALDEGPIKLFYERLQKSEAKHGHLFVQLLLKEFDEKLVYPRLEEFVKIEADIIQKLEIRPAMH